MGEPVGNLHMNPQFLAFVEQNEDVVEQARHIFDDLVAGEVQIQNIYDCTLGITKAAVKQFFRERYPELPEPIVNALVDLVFDRLLGEISLERMQELLARGVDVSEEAKERIEEKSREAKEKSKNVSERSKEKSQNASTSAKEKSANAIERSKKIFKS